MCAWRSASPGQEISITESSAGHSSKSLPLLVSRRVHVAVGAVLAFGFNSSKMLSRLKSKSAPFMSGSTYNVRRIHWALVFHGKKSGNRRARVLTAFSLLLLGSFLDFPQTT